MKTIRFFLAILVILLFVNACSNSSSRANRWSSEQKAEWTQNCMNFMDRQGVDKKDAEGFCDCMLKQTSERYTPEEAASITEEEERKMWQECDYVW